MSDTRPDKLEQRDQDTGLASRPHTGGDSLGSRVPNRGTRNKPPELSKIVAVPVLIETGFRIQPSAGVGGGIGDNDLPDAISRRRQSCFVSRSPGMNRSISTRPFDTR